MSTSSTIKTDALDKFQPGVVIADRFRLKEELGRGGHGAVYLAEQISVGRSVALKLMVIEEGVGDDVYARFEAEARQTCQLAHPNTVVCHDFGRDDQYQALFLAMEYLEGVTLHDMVQEGGALSPDHAIAILEAICASLEEAHGRGFIHRDLKPSNIMLVEGPDHRPHVKVIDFGIAKAINEDKGQGLTGKNYVMGTPHYMAPEQILSQALDERTDVYALGVLAFQMLTGERPFEGRNGLEVMQHHLHHPAPHIFDVKPQSTLPLTLDDVLQRAMAKDPEERFESVTLFAIALRTAWEEAAGSTVRVDPNQLAAALDEVAARVSGSRLTPAESMPKLRLEPDSAPRVEEPAPEASVTRGGRRLGRTHLLIAMGALVVLVVVFALLVL